ncbi:MAG: hypothetical protein IKU35_06835 [Bacteroidaceae bacterium]|nr:hypothetical protein [Bacteroidaceae bacterium]
MSKKKITSNITASIPTRKLVKVDYVIGIDPDVEKNGVAFLECATKRLEVTSLTFPDLLDFLRSTQRQAEVLQKNLRVIIEAGWLNKAHWHLTSKDSKQSAAAKGNAAGRNHEVGRKIAEICEHWQLPYELIKPLALKTGGVNLWKGKEGKITHEELSAFTGITGKTNQEGRDAALIAWTWAGFPMRILRK